VAADVDGRRHVFFGFLAFFARPALVSGSRSKAAQPEAYAEL